MASHLWVTILECLRRIDPMSFLWRLSDAVQAPPRFIRKHAAAAYSKIEFITICRLKGKVSDEEGGETSEEDITYMRSALQGFAMAMISLSFAVPSAVIAVHFAGKGNAIKRLARLSTNAALALGASAFSMLCLVFYGGTRCLWLARLICVPAALMSFALLVILVRSALETV